MNTKLKKSFLLIVISTSLVDAKKLSTGEKIAISVGAAGMALGACLIADAIEDFDLHFDIDAKNFKTDDLLDDASYIKRKMKAKYHYELALAREYEQARSIRMRENVEEDLCDYIYRNHTLPAYRHQIKYTILPRLQKIRYLLEDHRYDLSYEKKMGVQTRLHKCHSSLDSINNLINQFEIILEIINNARDFHGKHNYWPR